MANFVNKFMKMSSRAIITEATVLIWSKEMQWRSEVFFDAPDRSYEL
jgi:hypothetical protein